MDAVIEKGKEILDPAKPLVELGIHTNMPDKDYFAVPCISKHGLDLINQSGAHYKKAVIKQTPAMLFGSALHCYVLEHDSFKDRFAVDPNPRSKSKANVEWRESELMTGRQIISATMMNHIENMYNEIFSHPFVSIMLDPESGRAEQAAFWIDKSKEIWDREDVGPTYRLCKCKPDFINDAHGGIVIDLKTAQCAGESKFLRAVHNFRYHVQDVFYSDGLRQCGQRVKKFVFIAIEKEPPYAIGWYELSEKHRYQGRLEYKDDLLKYHDFMTRNEWPGYPIELRELEFPKYAEYVDVY